MMHLAIVLYPVCITVIGVLSGTVAAVVWGFLRNDPRLIANEPDWARDL